VMRLALGEPFPHAADVDVITNQRKSRRECAGCPVLLSRAVLMNRASAWARQAHEIMLDGEIAVLDDRGVTHIDDLQDAIAGHRPA